MTTPPATPPACVATAEWHPLSMFAATAVDCYGIRFTTAWQALAYTMFMRDGLEEVRAAVLVARSTAEVVAIVEANKHACRGDWGDRRASACREILVAKVTQNPSVALCLDATGDAVIHDNSWRHHYWGQLADGTGENTVGVLWSTIRDGIRGGVILPNLDANLVVVNLRSHDLMDLAGYVALSSQRLIAFTAEWTCHVAAFPGVAPLEMTAEGWDSEYRGFYSASDSDDRVLIHI